MANTAASSTPSGSSSGARTSHHGQSMTSARRRPMSSSVSSSENETDEWEPLFSLTFIRCLLHPELGLDEGERERKPRLLDDR